MSKAIVWSKPSCSFCVQAKNLLALRGIDYEEREIGNGYTVEQLFEVAPNAKSVPQIIINNELVGGYTELKKYLGV